jgi:hypothetical protein
LIQPSATHPVKKSHGFGRPWKFTMHARGGVAPLQDAHRLRVNSYRVLLTRGREASVIVVPPVTEMDGPAEHLRLCEVLGL